MYCCISIRLTVGVTATDTLLDLEPMLLTVSTDLQARGVLSDDFDMVAMESINNKYLGGDASLACSDTTASQIDQQVVALIKKQHDKA